MSATVPFGKYKGRPVEDMLADVEYMAWLEAQPWFRERFKSLLAGRDAEAASRTPVHNRLQTLFLDKPYCLAFVEEALPGALWEARGRAEEQASALSASLARQAMSSLATAKANDNDHFRHNVKYLKETAEACNRIAAEIRAHIFTPGVRTVFEQGGQDVGISYGFEYPYLNGPGYAPNPVTSALVWSFEPRGSLGIEIKPSVSDEYPAVLRQMLRNRSRYLFVDRYQGEGASEAQFVAIFAASGIKVVFKRDVDAKLGSLT